MAENKWLAARYGLDAPLMDLSAGKRVKMPARTLVKRRLRELKPIARELGCAEALAGIEALLEKGTVTSALTFYSMPTHWLGLMLIIVVGKAFPTGRMVDPFYELAHPGLLPHIYDVLRHMFLPSLPLGLVLYGQRHALPGPSNSVMAVAVPRVPGAVPGPVLSERSHAWTPT